MWRVLNASFDLDSESRVSRRVPRLASTPSQLYLAGKQGKPGGWVMVCTFTSYRSRLSGPFWYQIRSRKCHVYCCCFVELPNWTQSGTELRLISTWKFEFYWYWKFVCRSTTGSKMPAGFFFSSSKKGGWSFFPSQEGMLDQKSDWTIIHISKNIAVGMLKLYHIIEFSL